MQCNHNNHKLCEALGKHIFGRLWDIWQGTVLTVEKCHEYRMIWCREAGVTLADALSICPINSIISQKPGLVQLGANFAKAVTKYTKSGLKQVNEEVYKQRLEICENCVFKQGNTCLHKNCGCSLSKKAKWASE